MASVLKSLGIIKRWMVQQVALQAGQRLVWSPVFLGAGIGLYFALPYEPSFYVGMLVIALCCGAYMRARHDFAKVVVLFLGLFALGFSAASVRTQLVKTPLLEKDIKYTSISGQILKAEWLSADRRAVRLLLGKLDIEKTAPDLTPKYVRLVVRAKEKIPAYSVGSRVQGLAALHVLSDPLVPDGFDFRRFFFFKQIGATGFFYGLPKIVDEAEDNSGIYFFQSVKNKVQESVLSGRADLSSTPIIMALLTGERSAVAEHDIDAIRASGLAHMLAISGLHVGLFSGAVFFIVRLLVVVLPAGGLFLPAKKIAAVIAFFAALFYMQLAGATIPTQRAVLMVGVVFAAILMDRSALSMRLVSAAAFVILLFLPESLLSISFQLSFAAVVALICVYDWLRPFLSTQMGKGGFVRRAVLYIGGIALTSLVAAIATAPYTAYYFHELPLYGVFANLLAMPVLGVFVMPLAVLSLALMPFGAEGVALDLMGQGAAQILAIAHYVAGLELAKIALPAAPSAMILYTTLAGLALFLLRGSLKWSALLFLLIGAMTSFSGRYPNIIVTEGHKLWGYFYAADSSVDKLEGKNNNAYLYVSSLQKDRFARKQWQHYYGVGVDDVKYWRHDKNLRCDELACRLVLKGRAVSFVEAKEALPQECAWAEIIITRRSVRRSDDCVSPYVIDYWRAKNAGAQAVYVNDGNVKIVPVVPQKGRRPWR